MEAQIAKATSERLTWTEIRARYPDQWVVLVDVDWIDEDDIEFRTAVVLHHGKDRKAVLREAAPCARGYNEFASEFTGVRRVGLSPAIFLFPRT